MKKQLHLICNSHIDPMWLWEWEEGAAEAVSTFRVAAQFCREFDGFIFCHNEAILYKWVEEYDPDVIHLHNIHGYYINIKILFDYLRKSGKPVIWTLHDCWPFTGHCSHFVTVGCEKWKNGCFACSKRKAYPSFMGRQN